MSGIRIIPRCVRGANWVRFGNEFGGVGSLGAGTLFAYV